jgi:uncharacterized membrane protein
MLVLALGLLLWSVAHLFPAIAVYKRKKLMANIGIVPYKLGFAVLIFTSMALMVIGWRSITPTYLYALPPWVNYLTLVMVVITFILFVATQVKSNIKRVLRHPQLTGLIFWSTAHLLANGDSRSLLLFLSMLVWAILQIIMTNKRDGERVMPEKVSIVNDILTVVGGIAVFTAFLFAHPYIAGVSVIP